MAELSPKQFTYHWDNSKPIQFDLHTPNSYSPTTNTYKTLILYHSGGLVSTNRHMIPASVVGSLRQKDWLVISPDFHLLPESGLQDIRNDAEALENWLSKNHKDIRVDLERVAIGDASSGNKS
jgi:acetyl esterase/lipase